jgi:O-antigen/teichoic acid export membrane protein
MEHRAAAEQQELDPDELREAAVSGVRWFALAKVASEILQLVAAVALARLISPSDFGNAAVAMILLPLATILTYEGFGSALVQRKLITDGHYEAATLTSIASGFALSLLTFLLAPIVIAPIFGSEIGGLVRLMSPAFALAGLGAVSRAHLMRRLDFRTSSLIETSSLVLGSFAAVVLAADGLGAEALVLGGVTTTAIASLLLVAVAPPSRPRWRSQELAEITRFGSPAAAAGALSVAISNVDYAVLAARLNPAQVGIYWRAFQLGVLYQDKLSGVMMRLAFPLYSRTRDMDEMKRLHERATRVHGAVVVPLLATLIVTAPELVPFVFGDPWRAAVEPTQILAVAGMIAAILTGYPQVMLAAGRPRPLMIFNCCVLVVYGLVVYATAGLGLDAVAVAVVLVHVGMLAAVYLVLFRRVLGMPIGRLVGDLGPAVLGSAAIVAVGLPLAAFLREIGTAAPILILLAGGVGLLVQALTLRFFFPAVWADVSLLVRRVLPSRPRIESSGPDPTLIG